MLKPIFYFLLFVRAISLLKLIPTRRRAVPQAIAILYLFSYIKLDLILVHDNYISLMKTKLLALAR